ncbi:SHOCT domain-containing protein [Halopelagius longus]|uniref:SHOCT domain-containing protein n=1 Tax=Halopelagius longus TaxID=1236180 RepID=A0A1H1EEA8_9EURY|nr:SHOCT domain-containing protein [Halopelagius longus]RDI71713.1 SHOCT domain-containing protein [Halopelagius longus]SDQ86848.1 Short C-terminal domain-containing protein [Halopelagius longus]
MSDRSQWWGGDWGDDWEDASLDDDPIVEATSLLVVGLGLASMVGIVPIQPFWMVFVIGFAVVVPLVALLRKHQLDSANAEADRTTDAAERTADEDEGDTEFDDALARIRDRYARGELSEEQFERKLELLLETETPEDARERVRRARAERAAREAQTETESES